MHSGGYDGNEGSRDEVLVWNDKDWEEAGRMRMARHFHAVSIIRMDEDAMRYCE